MHHLSQRPHKLFKGEEPDIMFTEEDATWVHHPHIDALVIKVKIDSTSVHKVLVDNGNVVNVVTYKVY